MSNQEPLRILMTTDTVGGVWTYTIDLCKSLQPHNVHFFLVTAGAAINESQKKQVDSLANVTVFETTCLLEWMEDPWESIDASVEYLLQLEQKLKPHIIHLNGFVYGSLKWNAPVLVVAHSDVYSWWQAVKKAQPPGSWNDYFIRVKEGLSKADYLVAPSDWMMRVTRFTYAVTTPGEVIYNGRDASCFYNSVKQPLVFSMGRVWDEAKNISLLVSAASHINGVIKVAGEQAFENNSFDVEGSHVHHLGKLSADEIARLLSIAAIYVLPARYEPFGLSILEAALSGCALVLGDINSLREIWSDAAVFVDPNDKVKLAEAVNYLLSNEKARQQFASAAKNRAQQYTLEVMAAKYLQVYNSLRNQ